MDRERAVCRGRLHPDLATAVPSRGNGGISADLRTVTYHLRRGVQWQDGSPFTAADVAFTYQLQENPKVGATQKVEYDRILRLETPDPYTVRIRMKEPSPGAIYQIFVGPGGQILPKHILQHVADVRNADFNAHPVGTGPYELTSWDHGNNMELAANPHYFAGAPHVGAIVIQFVPAPTTRAVMLRKGELDVASVNGTDFLSLQAVQSLSMMSSRTYDAYFIALNTRQEPLGSLAVRHALAYATDRTALLRMLKGKAVPAATLVPPDSPNFDKGNGCFHPDAKRAQALLDQAGWRRGPSGIRMRNGRKFASAGHVRRKSDDECAWRSVTGSLERNRSRDDAKTGFAKFVFRR